MMHCKFSKLEGEQVAVLITVVEAEVRVKHKSQGTEDPALCTELHISGNGEQPHRAIKEYRNARQDGERTAGVRGGGRGCKGQKGRAAPHNICRCVKLLMTSGMAPEMP